MQPRIALILGNGKYAIALHQRLRCESQIAALSIALFPHGDTAVITADQCVDLLSLTQVLNLLKQHDITHVVFGGNFNFANISAAFQAKPWGSLRSVDRNTLSVLFGLSRGISYVLGQFCAILKRNGIVPVLASDYLADLKPGVATLIAAGRLATASNEAIQALAGRPAEQSLQLLASQPWRHVRQALLFEGDRLVLQESSGTDNLLSKAQDLPRTAEPRILVKLCPPDFDYRMDPPVVGPRTFALAAKAGVDLVVLEGNKGILFERDHVIECCRADGITVVGIESDGFRQQNACVSGAETAA